MKNLYKYNLFIFRNFFLSFGFSFQKYVDVYNKFNYLFTENLDKNYFYFLNIYFRKLYTDIFIKPYMFELIILFKFLNSICFYELYIFQTSLENVIYNQQLNLLKKNNFLIFFPTILTHNLFYKLYNNSYIYIFKYFKK